MPPLDSGLGGNYKARRDDRGPTLVTGTIYFPTNEGLPQARTSDRRKPAKGCEGEAIAGGCGGVPHNNDTPSLGQGDEVDQLADLTSHRLEVTP